MDFLSLGQTFGYCCGPGSPFKERLERESFSLSVPESGVPCFHLQGRASLLTRATLSRPSARLAPDCLSCLLTLLPVLQTGLQATFLECSWFSLSGQKRVFVLFSPQGCFSFTEALFSCPGRPPPTPHPRQPFLYPKVLAWLDK